MNLFRSIFLVRSIVLLMISMVLFNSIDSPDAVRTTKIDSASSQTFVHMVVFDHDAEHKEGRTFSGLEINLYKDHALELDLSNLSYIEVAFNSPNAISLFESVPFDLPSPPPKG